LLPNTLEVEEYCGHRGFMQIVRARSLDHHLKHVRVHDVWPQDGEWLMERPEGTQAHSVGIGDLYACTFSVPHACERVPHIMSDTCELVKTIGSIVASTT
jgi:hypothetical protein